MSQLQRITNTLGAGTFAHLVLPKLRAACDQLGATRALLTQGDLEFNRATVTGAPSSFGRDGVLDVSPSEKDIHNAIGTGTGNSSSKKTPHSPGAKLGTRGRRPVIWALQRSLGTGGQDLT